MSQRMTDTDFHRRFNARHLTDLQVLGLRGEAERARSEEARLLEENERLKREMVTNAEMWIDDHNATVAGVSEVRAENQRLSEENRKQAEQIQALADALESVKRRGLAADDVYEQVNAALRLCGRLP